MLKLLKRLFSDPHRDADQPPPPAGSGIVTIDGHRFDFAQNARWHEDVPHPDWDTAFAWHDALPASRQAEAWLALERGWLDWLRGAIGLHYRLHESDTAFLLTTQPERLAQVKLAYLDATLRRIERSLDEIADHELGGKEILIALADEDDYYRYVSGFFPEDGTFGMSSGMHLGRGCGHFVTHGLELSKLEPTIVHEMTHSCVRHLPLPLWLNEGLAQAIEQRFAPTYHDPHTKLERLHKQTTFWTPDTIQEFWSGHASTARTTARRWPTSWRSRSPKPSRRTGHASRPSCSRRTRTTLERMRRTIVSVSIWASTCGCSSNNPRATGDRIRNVGMPSRSPKRHPRAASSSKTRTPTSRDHGEGRPSRRCRGADVLTHAPTK